MDLNFQKWEHSCVNCNKEYSSTSNKINNIIVNLRLPVTSSDTFMEEISVYEALSCLFHLHLIEKSNESTKKNTWVCFSCSLTLKDLYRRYREFSLLRHSSSYLSYKIEQLEKYILAGSTGSASMSMNTVPSYSELVTAPLVLPQDLVLPQQTGTVQQDQQNQLGLTSTADHVMGATKVLTTQSQGSVSQQQQQQHHHVQDIIFDPSMQLQQGLVEIVFNDSTAENAILASNTTINDFADLVTLPGYMVELAGGSDSPNFQKEIALVSQPMQIMMNNPPDVLLNPNPIGTSDRKPEVIAQKSKARAKNTNSNRKRNPPTASATSNKKRPNPNQNNQHQQAKSTSSGSSSGTKSKKNVKRKENAVNAGIIPVNSSMQESKKTKAKKTVPSSQQDAGGGTSSPKPVFSTIDVARTTPEPVENFRVASSEPPYSCPKCKKQLKDKCAYAKHVYNHLQQNKYPCPKCRLKYSKYSSLRQHCESHHFLTPIEPPTVRELKPKEIVHVVFGS